MSCRLFYSANREKLNSLKIAESENSGSSRGYGWGQMFLGSLRLAAANITLLKLIQKLTNKVLKDNFDVTSPEDIGENASTTPSPSNSNASTTNSNASTTPSPSTSNASTQLASTMRLMRVAEGQPEQHAIGVHEARAVLIDLVKQLLGYSKSTSALVDKTMSYTSVNGDQVIRSLFRWLSGEAHNMEYILSRLGGLSNDVYGILTDASKTDGDVVKDYKKPIIKALYQALGSDSVPKPTSAARLLLDINEKGGEPFLESYARDIIILIRDALRAGQRVHNNGMARAASFNSVSWKFKSGALEQKYIYLNKVVRDLIKGENVLSRYRRMAKAVEEFNKLAEDLKQSGQADKITYFDLINGIAKLLNLRRFSERKEELLSRIPNELSLEIEDALQDLGITGGIKSLDIKSADKMRDILMRIKENSRELFYFLREFKDDNSNLVENINRTSKKVNDAISAGKESDQVKKSLVALQTYLKYGLKEVVELKQAVSNFESDVDDHFLQRFKDVFNKLGSELSTIETKTPKMLSNIEQKLAQYTKANLHGLNLFYKIADDSGNQGAPGVGGAGANAAKPSENPAKPASGPVSEGVMIEDEDIRMLTDAWTNTIKYVNKIINGLSVLFKKIGDPNKKGGITKFFSSFVDEESATEPTSMPVVNVSFKNDKDIAPILNEIKSWFNKNEPLIVASMKKIMPGTGRMNHHTKEDMNTIIESANQFKNKAIASIDRLLS